MPAYNFTQMFAGAVRSGEKRQTIRQPRKRPTKVGDTLYLYTGMRTKSCEKLLETPCLAVLDVRVYQTYAVVDGQFLTHSSLDELARSDGFYSSLEFIEFFKKHYGLPFEGKLIKW